MTFGRIDVSAEEALTHVQALITSFVVPAKQERYLWLLGHPSRCREFFDYLHDIELDKSHATGISGKGAQDRDLDLMKSKAGVLHSAQICCVFDESMRSPDEIYKSTIQDAFHQHYPTLPYGKVFSVIPGRLAWYEGDMTGTYICERSAPVKPGAKPR